MDELLQVVADCVQSKFILAEIEGDSHITSAGGKERLKQIKEIIKQILSLTNGFILLAYYELTKIEKGTQLSFGALTGDREPIPCEME